MHETAPRELLRALKEMYRLDFEPVLLVECKQLEKHLQRYRKAFELQLGHERNQFSTQAAWDEYLKRRWQEYVSDLWEEYERYDSLLALAPDGRVCRFLTTITFMVARDRKHPRAEEEASLRAREFLKERIEWPDGRITERKHNNSLSEKWPWKKNGEWRLRFTAWRAEVRRAGLEELGIRLTRRFLRPPWLWRIGPEFQYFKDPETGAYRDVFVKRDDPARPGVTTYNLLLHFFLLLHEVFWKREYREPKYRKERLVKTMVHTWERAEAAVPLPASEKA